MERELKLRVSVKDLDKLRRAPLLAQSNGAHAPQLLKSTYFDTSALSFHGCGASLRVRAVGKERIQTLKLEGSVQAGLFDRDEFEMPVDGDLPDLARLRDRVPADSDCGRLIRDVATAARLQPVFVTRIKRSVLPLHLPSGGEVEVALDKGTVEAEPNSVPIAAVELELKRAGLKACTASHWNCWRSYRCASIARARPIWATDCWWPSTVRPSRRNRYN